MDDTIEDRLTAVERAVTDGDHDLADLATAAETGERLADLDAEVATLDERVAELEAATQALRGYVGNVRAVNEDVEQRADLALEKAAAALDATQDTTDGTAPGAAPANDEDPTGNRSAVDRAAPAGDVVGSRRSSSRARPQQSQDCVCGAADVAEQSTTDSAESRHDPTALANADGERATDGGTTGTPTAATDNAGILARIRDYV